MKKRIVRYIKHITLTFLVLLSAATMVGLYHGAAISYGHNPKRIVFDGEGPYVFYQNDSTVQVNYLRGTKEEGFYVDYKNYPATSAIAAKSYFALDDSFFEFTLEPTPEIPPAITADEEDIMAISDIESGYKTFRDFLIANQVIDAQLNWTYGKGHLVLVGDFVDRGFSTTQVLWFIYALEQQAKKQGGQVHFILGNHELKNMYGDYGAAALKYTFVASMLGKTQANLYDRSSFIGRWLATKNVIESINGNLFAHGGLHPEIASLNMSLPALNNFLRQTYYRAPYPKKEAKATDVLRSSKTGIAWYRGYFKEDLTQEQVEKPITKYGAKAIVVGHTLQAKIKSHYHGKVIGIDVKHPKDYHKNWPNKKSEGLRISQGKYYRVLANGTQIAL